MRVTGRVDVDFDHHSVEWLRHRHAHNAELRAVSPIVWNSRYGFWYVTGYHEALAIARDGETFTLRYDEQPSDGLELIGVTGVPRAKGLPPVGIAEADQQRHAVLRRLLSPLLGPAAAATHEPMLGQCAEWFIDQKISEGAMDLVGDFANGVPAVLTLKLLGLPCDQWRRYAKVVHDTSAYRPGTPQCRQAVAEIPVLLGEILALVAERRRDPGDDMLSELVTADLGGGTLGDGEASGVLWNLVAGGLDTTAALTSLALYHLDEDLELRARLAADPTQLFAACEEYLRATSVNETVTCTCTRDTLIADQWIRRGDLVMVSWLAANFDPKVFEHPEEIDVGRTNNAHLAFGSGPHRCVGMHFARLMFRVMVRVVLERIPDYRLVRRDVRFYEGNPLLAGVVTMPATFTARPALGIRRPY